MTGQPDFQLIKIRKSLMDLLKSFFYEEPDANRLGLWRGVVYSLSKESVSPEMDAAIKELSECLSERGLKELQEEYYELFVNPFSKHSLKTTLSFYTDGHNFGSTLVAIREFLKNVGIQRREGVNETEDSLPVMLDIYQQLIAAEEKQGGQEAVERQAEFLKKFLVPLGKAVEKGLEANEKAHFYRACCHFLNACLLMESSLTFEPAVL